MNTLQQLRQYVDGLGRRSTLHYGQLLLLIVLSLALWIGHSRISERVRMGEWGFAPILDIPVGQGPRACPLGLERHLVGAALQAITLLAELAALIAIFWRPLRVPVALTLIGFHFGSTFLMGLNFTGNVILLALVFLPAREALQSFISRHVGPAGSQTLVRFPKTFLGSLGSGMRTRVNVFGQWKPEEKSLSGHFR